MNDFTPALKSLTIAFAALAVIALFWSVVFVVVLVHQGHELVVFAGKEVSVGMSKYLWPYTLSVVVAILPTHGWSIALHKAIRYSLSVNEQEVERIWWIPMLVGVFERAIITTLVGWKVQGAAGFIAAWIGVKAAGGWGKLKDGGTTYSRSTYFVGLLGNALSVLFAIVGGLLISGN